MSSGIATLESLSSLGSSLQKEGTESPTPSVERCLELIAALSAQKRMTISLLQKSQIGKILTRSIKSFKRHQRTSSTSSSTDTNDWTAVITKAEEVLQSWKETADNERKAFKTKKEMAVETKDVAGALPDSISSYKNRLVKQSKEIYKDPPILPPPKVTIDPETYPPPTRSKTTRTLSFKGPESLQSIISTFKPNLTPEEVLRGGSFGGTYFRPIHSAVTNVVYDPLTVLKTSVSAEWISGLNRPKLLTSKVYDTSVNKFKVKCGGSLGMWESSGWISDCDPYGWFQWYCRFYNGRRCDDDERQIKRWAKCAGEKGRFLSQLCNKIIKGGKDAKDASVSPVIRQTLWHWGLEVDEFILERHRKRIGA